MAGHRRAVRGRGGRQSRATARRLRRREYLTDRMGRARGPVARLAAAFDYARMVLADMNPRAAEPVAAELVDVMVATVDRASANSTPTSGR